MSWHSVHCLVHVMLLTFWHSCIGKLVEIGLVFSWMYFLYLLLFHSPQSILSLWVKSSVSRWMTRNRGTLLMPASSETQKRQTDAGNVPPLAKRWSRNRSCHSKLEDCGDIGSSCWHWPRNMDSNIAKCTGADAAPVQAGLWRLWWGSTSTSPW